MQQGWPKLASNVLLLKHARAGDPPTVAVAMLAPVEASIRWGDAKVTTIKVVTDYPFGDNATIFVRGVARLEIRVPGWATQAMMRVDGAPAFRAANGTMHPIKWSSRNMTVVELFLNPVVRVEYGWGRAASNGSSTIFYTSKKTAVPTAQEQDWSLGLPTDFLLSQSSSGKLHSGNHRLAEELDDVNVNLGGGCEFTPSRGHGIVADLRSGSPGQVTTAVVSHPIWGVDSPQAQLAHSIASLELSFRYAAGYGPAGGIREASTLSVVLLDAINQTEIATLYSSPPLADYSYDEFKGYSPPIKLRMVDLDIPNGRAVLVALRFHNNDRNLQVQTYFSFIYDVRTRPRLNQASRRKTMSSSKRCCIECC